MGTTVYTVGTPFGVRAFNLIAQEIREQDRKVGLEFLERFYEGIQATWDDIRDDIDSVKNLWSVLDCPDDLLQFLKNIVGWTKVLDNITDGLDAATLRRLISVSVAMWKSRTTEDSYTDALNLLVPGRARVWNWFYFRFITGVVTLDEQRQGRDPWMLSFPGTALGREYYSNLRLVDPGNANKQLTRDIVKLLRPVGERVEIVYLNFLDLFEIDDDLSQWDVDDAATMSVADGLASIPTAVPARHAFANADGSEDWDEYVAYARVRGGQSSGGGFGISFFVTPGPFDNFYYAVLDIEGNDLLLRKVVGGAHSAVASFDFDPVYLLQDDVWYSLRVQASPDGGSTRIKVYVDGVERIDVTDASHTQGTAGLYARTNSYMDADELEILGLPVESETVDINS